ncbi:beclin 1 [Metschnikowia aff. pulcherrima]|uniref:Beclin 1 n=1 Tax=Metschnikowia aff. pulcherrima TaxID=2163413 RepID=A0A4P6XSV9_9ASCO|nr:beclin 1 [Metschnikowia aff. pulcherrima]
MMTMSDQLTKRPLDAMPFECQQCGCLITLDASFESVSRAEAKLLVSKVPKLQFRGPSLPTHFIPKSRLALYQNVSENNHIKAAITQDYTKLEGSASENLGQSFVYISESKETDVDQAQGRDDNKEANAWDTQLPDFSKIKTLNQVFEILSTNQDVAHPMCCECSDLLTDNYKLKFDLSQREKEYYMTFLRKLKDQDVNISSENQILGEALNQATQDVKELEILEHERLNQLELSERKNRELKSQLESLEELLNESQSNQLNRIHQMKNTLSLNLQGKQRKLDQAKALYQNQIDHLDELRKFNVFHKLYEILFEDDYGQINGFRLGYKVPWAECNVALGQIVLLLFFLQKRLEIVLENYKLVPLGSKSYVVKQLLSHPELGRGSRNGSVLPLYSTSEFTLGKLFNFNKLDISMMALLEILSQFEAQLVRRDSGLAFPYKTTPKNGTLGGKSVRVTSNGQWTEACRYLLVNMKWILGYASAQQSD